MRDDCLAEMLAGAGLAARFAADSAIWDTFTRWAAEKGYLGEDETASLSREAMMLSSMTLYSVIREVQEELLSRAGVPQLQERSGTLRSAHVARVRGVRRNGREPFLPGRGRRGEQERACTCGEEDLHGMPGPR